MQLVIDNSYFWSLAIEIKKQGETLVNFKGFGEETTILTIPERSKSMSIKTKFTKRVKNCDEKNRQRPFDCINDFIQSKLKCPIPWRKGKKETNETCDAKQTIEWYLGNQASIFAQSKNEELKEFGCMISNCEETIWSLEETQTFSSKITQTWGIPSNKTLISIPLNSMTVSEQN